MKNSSIKRIEVATKRYSIHIYLFFLLCMAANTSIAQQLPDSTTHTHQYKNVIRYNLSGALLFGFDRFVVFGYERVIRPHQSISVNFGKASLPKLVTISTDSFNLTKDQKSTGINVSVDYRFYLKKENKFMPPHGLYIGPYYAYNSFKRDNQWQYKTGSANSYENTHTKLSINTVGFELGYQFILWKRLALDLVLIGPGIGFYDYKAKFDGNIDAETKEQLVEGLKQLLTQKFPGMNWVFADKEINANGTLNTTTLGYRYLVHIGFNF